jgi:formylglycine-generating enzyme required for sulfatase activity
VDHFDGDPNVDPEARSFEGPVHTVVFEKPFLLSKYEMTQGQFLWFTGNNPSSQKPGDISGDKVVNLLHPVENVSWEDCDRVLFQLNLRLPSEAEWEYACRAGSGTVFWTGNEKESLKGAVNIGDQSLRKKKKARNEPVENWLNDGYADHAPVGTYYPNPFGLHDVIGNVFEWCQDSMSRSYENAPTDGSAFETSDSTHRAYRGGCFWSKTRKCRSAYRHFWTEGHRQPSMGLRPAFSLP